MSFTSEQSTVTYAGNNSTSTPYTVPFAFFTAADLLVTRIAENGEETELTLTTDYTVSGGDAEAGATGSITTVAAIAATKSVRIDRVIELVQPDSFSDLNRFPASTVERLFDRAYMALQQQQRDIDRAYQVIDGGNA